MAVAAVHAEMGLVHNADAELTAPIKSVDRRTIFDCSFFSYFGNVNE